MGYGYTYKCKKCGHEYSVSSGIGMLYPNICEEELEKIKAGKYGEEWPEGQDYVLRLAMAYGGYGAMEKGIDDTALPAEFLIDYVRFYKLKE